MSGSHHGVSIVNSSVAVPASGCGLMCSISISRAQPEAQPPDLDRERRRDGAANAGGAPVAREAAEHDRDLEQELALGQARDPEPPPPGDDEAVGRDRRVAGVVVEAEADAQEQLEALVLHLELEPRVDVLDVPDRDRARLVGDVDGAGQLGQRRQVVVLEDVREPDRHAAGRAPAPARVVVLDREPADRLLLVLEAHLEPDQQRPGLAGS